MVDISAKPPEGREASAPRPRTAIAGAFMRFALLLALIVAATWLTAALRDYLDMEFEGASRSVMTGTLIALAVVFALLLAVPFVPGVEIGLLLLGLFGASVAPLVYGAALAGIMLAYAIGVYVPLAKVARLLRSVGLTRIAARIAKSAALPRKKRLSLLTAGQSPRLVKWATKYRYLALIAALNMPGNVVLGGGGGIAMAAGTSGLFAPLPFFATVAVAVAPVPLGVMLFGA